MKILVTGYMGLIGGELAHRLNLFHEVWGFDKLSAVDLTRFNEKFDLIIHCAANSIIREIIEEPNLAIENISLTYDVFELARRTAAKVVVFSSGRVRSEEYNPYIVSKLFAENMAKAYYDSYGVEYMIIRPENVWGENDNKKRVIPQWIKAASKNKDLIIYGSEDKELSPIHVSDFVEEVLSLISHWEFHKNKNYSIRGHSEKAVEIAKIIIDELNSESKIVFKDAEKTQPQKVLSSGLESEFIATGKSIVDFKEKLREVVEYGNIANIIR